MKKHWREKCEQLLTHEEALEEKDSYKVMLLKARILSLTRGDSVEDTPTSGTLSTIETVAMVDPAHQHSLLPPLQEASAITANVSQGKAPPVEPYTRKNPDVL